MGCAKPPRRCKLSGSKLAVQGGTAYWADLKGQTVAKCLVAGCANTPIPIVTGLNSPYGLATDATSAYFTDLAGTVLKCPLTGCGNSPTSIATGQSMPHGIAIDGTNVYWTNDIAGGSIMKCPLSGGCGNNPTVLATGLASPYSIAVDATSVYWTNFGDGTVMKLTPK